jgi:tetratricopeptide (TPR) repeat protein
MFRCCTNLAVAVLIAFSLASCRSKVPASTDSLAQVQTSTVTAQGEVPAQIGERYDPAQEEVVANQSIKAWRIALSHHKQGTMSDAEWKKVRAADEKESMARLKDLHERYPKNSTVQLMMGQVMHEFGRESEAVEFYEQAIAANRGASMYVFKLAESARIAGDTKKAIKNYRKLLSGGVTGGIAPIQLGLAKALLKEDPKSTEARDLIQKVLETEPNNQDALQVKKQMQASQSIQSILQNRLRLTERGPGFSQMM